MTLSAAVHFPFPGILASPRWSGGVRLKRANRGGRGGSRRIADEDIGQSAQDHRRRMKVHSALAPGLHGGQQLAQERAQGPLDRNARLQAGYGPSPRRRRAPGAVCKCGGMSALPKKATDCQPAQKVDYRNGRNISNENNSPEMLITRLTTTYHGSALKGRRT